VPRDGFEGPFRGRKGAWKREREPANGRKKKKERMDGRCTKRKIVSPM